MPPDPMTMGALLRQASKRWPQRTAIEDGGRHLSFPDLSRAANAMSKALVARGFATGDRVAIWAPNMADWIIVAAGAEQIGVVVVPLNTRFKGREAEDILGRAGVRLLFSVRDFLGLDLPAMLDRETLPLLEDIVTLDGLDAWIAAGASVDDAALEARIDAVGDDAIADILYTSGTTGRPKGVMSSHGQNQRSFIAWADAVGLREGDRYLIVNPFFHTFGYKAGWLACLLRGATALPVAAFDAGAVLTQIARDRVTVLPGAPTIYLSLLEHPSCHDHDLSSLRLAVTGAASVPPILIRRMREELGIPDVLTAYGLTEATGVVTVSRSGDPAELIATSCGLPIPGVEVRLVDEAGACVADGAPGELHVRGFNVMRGYLDDPAATAEAIDADGWLRTGDIAVRAPSGHLSITDRLKDMFISGGFNCYPAEIESLIMEHPGVARVAVVGIPDARMGEVPSAFVVPVAGATIEPQALVAWCRANMANYKAPRTISVVEALPTNAAGKVQRFILKQGSDAATL